VIVARLRRKVGKDAIETVRGRGYRLVDGGSA
jgi:DNA-binding response OmpR family regulator